MGMDLKPMRPTKDAPRHPADDKWDPNGPVWGRYNWSGWRFLMDKLHEWGMEMLGKGFSGMNDGELIRAPYCREVADLIEKNLHTLSPEDQEWLKPHIILWRTCGGYRQY